MRKVITVLGVISLLAIIFTSCGRKTAGGAINQQVTSFEGEPILLGVIDRAGLQQEPYADWFNANYNDYQVDEATLAPVKERLQEVGFKVFMGTWCSDSQLQVPQFYKILDMMGVDEKKLTVVSLDNHPDRRKTSPGGEEQGWNIEYVPTFIFIENGEELGRIVEYPMTTLEEDMAKILGN